MKNLFLFAFVLLGLFSCQESFIEIESPNEETVDLPSELLDMLNQIETRGDWPKDAWEMVDFLNNANFTHGRYKDCTTDPIYASYSAGNDTDPNEQYGPIVSNPYDYEYTFSDLSTIVSNLWAKVNKECDTNNVVILDVDFSVGFFGNGNTTYYIDASVKLCCDPTFNPKDQEGPKQVETPTMG